MQRCSVIVIIVFRVERVVVFVAYGNCSAINTSACINYCHSFIGTFANRYIVNGVSNRNFINRNPCLCNYNVTYNGFHLECASYFVVVNCRAINSKITVGT